MSATRQINCSRKCFLRLGFIVSGLYSPLRFVPAVMIVDIYEIEAIKIAVCNGINDFAFVSCANLFPQHV